MQTLISIVVILIILLICALPGAGIAYVTRRKMTKAGNSKAKMVSIIAFIVMYLVTLATLFMVFVWYTAQFER